MLNGFSSQKIKIKKMILFHYAILLATFKHQIISRDGEYVEQKEFTQLVVV